MQKTLDDILIHATEQFMNMPVLRACRDDSLLRDQFNVVAQGRFGAGAPLFELLLETAIRRAGKEHPLTRALTLNLCDERGIRGAFDPKGSHAGWRHDFQKALKINTSNAYSDHLEAMMVRQNLAEMAGALLWLEYSIPHEFEVILGYLERTWPEQFADRPENAWARLYLADHIRHDADWHYPDMRRGIEASDFAFADLQKGIESTALAKGAAFYGLA